MSHRAQHSNKLRRLSQVFVAGHFHPSSSSSPTTTTCAASFTDSNTLDTNKNTISFFLVHTFFQHHHRQVTAHLQGHLCVPRLLAAYPKATHTSLLL